MHDLKALPLVIIVAVYFLILEITSYVIVREFQPTLSGHHSQR